MKTSVIEVRDMLSVLTVDEVEKRIGNVPGVASATVNYAARNATVRYDETRLNVADIKVIVHQRGRQSADEPVPTHVSEHKPAQKQAVAPTPGAAPASASTPIVPAVPAPVAPAVDDQDPILDFDAEAVPSDLAQAAEEDDLDRLTFRGRLAPRVRLALRGRLALGGRGRWAPRSSG